ncbi:putative Saccharopine dehydrogenase [Ilyonectria robusta]
MAKSVGVTCGIATQLLLDGLPALNEPGVLAPYTREICDPIRVKLEEEERCAVGGRCCVCSVGLGGGRLLLRRLVARVEHGDGRHPRRACSGIQGSCAFIRRSSRLGRTDSRRAKFAIVRGSANLDVHLRRAVRDGHAIIRPVAAVGRREDGGAGQQVFRRRVRLGDDGGVDVGGAAGGLRREEDCLRGGARGGRGVDESCRKGYEAQCRRFSSHGYAVGDEKLKATSCAELQCASAARYLSIGRAVPQTQQVSIFSPTAGRDPQPPWTPTNSARRGV